MNSAVLENSGIAIVIVYLLSLIIVGYVANRARKESSLRDYYLAGGSFGVLSLFFTLYATQYSGNSMFGTPGMAYSGGIIALALAIGMMGIIGMYSYFGPSLNRLSKEHQFVSVGDFVYWRYRSKALLILANIIFVITLINYSLANMKAVGLLLESATAGKIPFAAGVILVCLIMAIYESLGGMRSVVWTDVIQGSLLMLGCLLVFVYLVIFQVPGEIIQPEILFTKISDYAGRSENAITFISLVLLIIPAAAVYPQAIQRLYAAKNVITLQRSYRILFFMPLFTVFPLILIGMSATEWFPGLSRQESEGIVIFTINGLAAEVPYLSWLLILFLAAAIAAIMSTIDSALLSLGSIFSKDVIARRNPQIGGEQLHRFSRILSWGLMALMGALAILLPQTIWTLMVFKLEWLIQAAPLIILSVRRSNLNSRALLAGLIVGCCCVLFLKFSLYLGAPLPGKPMGIHAGIWAVALNALTIFVFTSVKSRSVQP